MRFQHEDSGINTINPDEIQATRYIDEDIIVLYVAGDCDVFLPYVELPGLTNRAWLA